MPVIPPFLCFGSGPWAMHKYQLAELDNQRSAIQPLPPHEKEKPQMDGVFFDPRKSAILHIRPTSMWFYCCYMDLWP